MASLSTFPVEVIEWITGMLITSEQMRLWQCGDHILNTKLKTGGLTSTTLHWSYPSWMPWTQPFFAIFTRLRTVNWTVDTRSTLCPAMDLNHLPSTLHRLQLDFDDVFYLLRQQNVNLNELFPSLQVLKLRGKRLIEENLKQLPQHLLVLSVDSEDDSRESKRYSKIQSRVVFRDLPTTLEHLDFNFAVVDQEEVGNALPTGLKSLRLAHIEANFEWFLKLPRSLKKLTIHSTNFTHLDCSVLPTELEELDLGMPASTARLPMLPTGLTSLKFPIAPSVTDADIEFLPKGLTKLDVPRQQITHVGLQRFPITLTDASLSIKVSHPDMLSFFHPETTTIHLLKGASFLPLNIFPLPHKLTSLTIYCMNDEICGLLPPGMTYLKLDGGLITSNGACKLPKSLKYLSVDVSVIDINETISFISFVPHIRFASSDGSDWNVTENWLSFLKAPSLLNSNAMIPEINFIHSDSGKTLEMEFWVPKMPLVLGESAFQSLSSFTHLSVLRIRLSSVTFIPASYIQYVPKTLTDLEFGYMGDFPTATDLSTLPKCLRFLEIWVDYNVGSMWKIEDIKALPRSLQILNLNCSTTFPKLALNVTSYLSPYMMEVNANNAAWYRFKVPLDRWYPRNPTLGQIPKPDLSKEPLQQQKPGCEVM